MQGVTSFQIFYAASSMVVALCVLVILVAMLADFVEFHRRSETRKTRKSIVATGTMLMFFLCFFVLMRFRTGALHAEATVLSVSVILLGLALLVAGCAVNVMGRLALGKNWANHIKIYSDHTLVADGVYRFVRHPLYASLIWMFLGASLVYFNYLAFLADILVFTPFMYYRARQEEELLGKEFEGYKEYQQRVGMFFPKIFRRIKP